MLELEIHRALHAFDQEPCMQGALELGMVCGRAGHPMPHKALRFLNIFQVIRLLPNGAFPSCERSILRGGDLQKKILPLNLMAQEIWNLCDAGYRPYEAINLRQTHMEQRCYVDFYPITRESPVSYWVKDRECHTTLFWHWIKTIRGDDEYEPHGLTIFDSIASLGRP